MTKQARQRTLVFALALALGGTAAQAGPELIRAAFNGDLAGARTLLAAGEKVNEADAGGWTPLMWAVYRHQQPMVDYLLDHGADPNLQATAPYKQLAKGATALIIASYYGLEDTVASLTACPRIFPSLTDETGQTALDYARTYNFQGVLKYLDKDTKAATKSYEHCLKTIYFIDDKVPTKPYRIITLVTRTEVNGNDDSVYELLKVKACQAGGDALTVPERLIGPRNTTYTSRVIVWDPPR